MKKRGKDVRFVEQLKPPPLKNASDDPDAKDKAELKGERHKIALLVHKVFRGLVIALVPFTIILLFIILPVSEMPIEDGSRFSAFRDWSIAFISTTRTAGIALATIVVSALLKKLWDYLEKHFRDNG